MALSNRAATFGAGTPELVGKVVSGDSADTDIYVPGLYANDIVVAVVNLSDGTAQTVNVVSKTTIQLDEDTSSDSLFVLFWSVGLGGTGSSS